MGEIEWWRRGENIQSPVSESSDFTTQRDVKIEVQVGATVYRS